MMTEKQTTHQTRDRLDLLYSLSQTFSSSLDLDEVLSRVMDEVIAAVKAERGFVMLIDQNGSLEFKAARGIDQRTIDDPQFQVSRSIVERVARDGKPVLTSDAQSDERFNMRQSVMLLGLRSILSVPLTQKNNLLGVIYVDNHLKSGIFSPSDLELLSAIASSAAIAIENARLYRLAVEKGRLERELQMARQVQLSLLPDETPQIPGWEFAATWLPARQVAGDYYDFINFDDGKVGVVIADVTDKGMPSALFMAMTRSVIRASVNNAQSPVAGIRNANRLICADTTGGMFVTLFYAQIDPILGSITYVNAGHNPPLYAHLHPQNDELQLEELSRTGIALGVLPDMSFSEKTITLLPGESLLLYTDGVTDAHNNQEVDYGTGRLESFMKFSKGKSAEETITALIQSVQNFTQDSKPFDDLTVAMIRRLPTG